MFRDLRADEIECRVSTISEKGLSLLLYKDARCDMNILDETVGPMNWQRDHKELKGNMYAGIGIWNKDIGQWIWKWDCGAESFTEKEKGEASDSFKRAGFNVGIGRELYTAPFVYVKADKCKIDFNNKTNKYYTNDRFEVTYVEIENKKIKALVIANSRTHEAVYEFGKPTYTPKKNESKEPVKFSPKTKCQKCKKEITLEQASKSQRDTLKAGYETAYTLCDGCLEKALAAKNEG